MCRARPWLTGSNGRRVNVRQACATLARWDGRGNTSSRGEVLWRQFIDQSDVTWWPIPFNPAHPLTTPRGINTSLPAVQRAFADTVQYFRHNHIPLGTWWAQPSDTRQYPCQAATTTPKAASTSS